MPTRKSMYEALELFFGEKPFVRCSTNYGKGAYQVKGELLWQRRPDYYNEKMKEFRKFLKSKGVNVGSFRPYESPIVGSIIIYPKED